MDPRQARSLPRNLYASAFCIRLIGSDDLQHFLCTAIPTKFQLQHFAIAKCSAPDVFVQRL